MPIIVRIRFPGRCRRPEEREGPCRSNTAGPCHRLTKLTNNPGYHCLASRGVSVQKSSGYRYRWAILFAAFVAGMAGPIALFAMPPLFPALTVFLGIPLSDVGFATMTGFGIGISIMAIPFAILSPASAGNPQGSPAWGRSCSAPSSRQGSRHSGGSSPGGSSRGWASGWPSRGR